MPNVRCLGIMMCLLPCSLTVRNEDREERNRRASYDPKAEGNADFEERSVAPTACDIQSCVSRKVVLQLIQNWFGFCSVFLKKYVFTTFLQCKTF